MRFLITVFLLLSFNIVMAAGSFIDSDFEKIENVLFALDDTNKIKGMLINEEGIGLFQNAIVYYRLGNLTTNVEYTKKAIVLLEKLTNQSDNVYALCYLALAYGGMALLSPNPIEKLDYVGRTLPLLNIAVTKYPNHYLPRLYRGISLIMLPGFAGGDIDKGIADLSFVLSKMEEIKRDNDFKSFIYFMYGVTIAEKKSEYKNGIGYLSKACTITTKDKMREAINKKIEEYGKKIELYALY